MRKFLIGLSAIFLATASKSFAQWNLTGNSNATTNSIVGTTNGIPLNLATKNTKRLTIDSLGRIGIGTTSPINILTIKGAGSTPAASWVTSGSPLFTGFGENTPGNADFSLMMASNNQLARPVLSMKKAQGTLAFPAKVGTNEQLGSLLVGGFDGTNFQGSAAVDFFSDGTITTGNVPARISFVTGTNSSNRTERVQIRNNGDIFMNSTVNGTQFSLLKATGNVGVGTASPAAKLDVRGDALINGLTVGTGPNNIASNTALGKQALYHDSSTGSDNVAIGYYALSANKGYSNTAVGSGAMNSNTTGYRNVANGDYSLAANITGSYNSAVGESALEKNINGNSNVAMGYEAMWDNTSGTFNTGIGVQALAGNTVGAYNTALGMAAGNNSNNLSNAVAIGYNAKTNVSNRVLIGNGSISSIGGQVGWTNFSDGRIKQNIRENVPGLSFINLLKPVTYNFSLAKEYELTGKADTNQWDGKYDIEKINFTGFIAQDVQAAAKKIGYDFSGVDARGNIMGLRYAEFVVPLVKAVQELSAKNGEMENENKELKKQNESLEARLERLESLMNVKQAIAAK